MIPEQCDVIVIGSGPAGSMAAGLLARDGHDVVLLDKQKHPRYTVGESLIPDFWKFCDALGVTERVMAEGFIIKAGGAVLWKDEMRTVSFKDFGYTRPALHVERERFDQILFDRACELGASAFEGVTVNSVNFIEDGTAEVLYRHADEPMSKIITCRFVVDASGQRAIIGSQLQLREIDPNFRFMSVWGYYKKSAYFAPDGSIQPSERVQELSPVTYISSIKEADHKGWMWHIMQREQTSIGFVMPVDSIKRLKGEEDWETFFLDMCSRTPHLPELLRNAEFIEGSVRLIRDYSYRMTRLTGPGFFLVGDAAGFIDPVYSNGVVLAMYTGYLAAWCLNVILKDSEKTEQYQSLFASQVQHRMELARALALPNYQGGVELDRGMRSIWEMSRGNEKRLIAAAAALTGREMNLSNI